MPSFLDRLFRRSDKPSAVVSPAWVETARPSNPMSILVPEGMPAELLVRVPTPQPRGSSQKRKRRTPEEKAADHKVWVEGMLHQARVQFDFDRGRAEGIGVTHYRWRSAGDGNVCKVCSARNGKRFPLRGAEDFNHPGFMLCACDSIDDGAEAGPRPCRCYAEMILPK